MGCLKVIAWGILLLPVMLIYDIIKSIKQHRKQIKKEKQEQRIRDKIEKMLDEQNEKTP